MSKSRAWNPVYWVHEKGVAMCKVCGKKRNTLRSVQRHFKQKHLASVLILREARATGR